MTDSWLGLFVTCVNREEVIAKRAGIEYLVRRASDGAARQRYIYKTSEIGEPPVLHEE